jgi:hypothetical protein
VTLRDREGGRRTLPLDELKDEVAQGRRDDRPANGKGDPEG